MSVNQIQVHVENIKCGGCEKSIVIGLMSSRPSYSFVS
jgi:hypothetical protein